MNGINSRDLDNYITGHYGEDQFKGEEDPGLDPSDWPETVHADYIRANSFRTVYTYDPAADGPECEVITRILAHHSAYVPGGELQCLQLQKFVDDTARKLFNRRYGRLSPARQAIVRAAVIRAKALGRAV
jgi:hypothetical protein